MLKKGDRVRYSKQGLERFGEVRNHRATPERRGIAMEQKLRSTQVGVIWDGNQQRRYFHESYIEKVPDAE